MTGLPQGQKGRPDFSPQGRRLRRGAALQQPQGRLGVSADGDLLFRDGELGGRPQCRTERDQLRSCAAAGQTGGDRHFLLLPGWEDDPGPAAAAPDSALGGTVRP